MGINLVVGNTSQLSHYFPKEYERSSSREIFPYAFTKKYDRVFLSFGVSKKGLKKELYDEINTKYTMELARKFSPIANKVVVYATCELWSACTGKVSIERMFEYYDNPYIISKHNLVKEVVNSGLSNVIIIYPFNFNSPYRSKDFLFGKIFDSIINKVPVEIGNTHINRDMVSPQEVVHQSITSGVDCVVGSGVLTNVNDFIRMLYNWYDMDYNQYVTESLDKFKFIKNNEYYFYKLRFMQMETLVETTIKNIDKCLQK